MKAFLKKIIWLILAAPAFYLVIVWNKLPEKVALHFNLQGIADRYGSKKELLFYIPLLIVISLALYYLLPRIYKIDPSKKASQNKYLLKKIAFVAALFISFVACMIIYSAATGSLKLNIRFVFGSIGLMYCILGNYFNNIKPNYFAGYRVPWTLSNEDIWKKTHRLGAWFSFAGGLVIFVLAFIVSKNTLIAIFVCVSVLITFIPVIYSYILYRKLKTNHQTNV